MDVPSAETGMLELTILNADTKDKTFTDTVVDLLNAGIPPELVTRLQEVWEFTKTVAGEVVNVGKIIIEKIAGFAKAHPNLAAGVAVGAGVSWLVSMVPFLGPVLAPIVAVVGVVVAAGTGARMDKGEHPGGAFETAIELARQFFESLASIFLAIKEYWEAA